MASLRDRQESVRHISAQALRGDLAPEQIQQLADVLALCERILRRRQALRDSG
jgi:hypothetical protein